MTENTFISDEFPLLTRWEVLYSNMIFPNDLVKQQAFVTKCQYERMRDTGLLTLVSEKKLREIIDAAFMSEPVSKEVVFKAGMQGVLAGLQLYICLMHHNKNEHTGLKRTRSIIDDCKDDLFSDPSYFTTSISSLERIWKKYYSVSHFWAAAFICRERDIEPHHEVLEFMQISNGIGKLAANCFPDSKNPILNLKDLFLPPDDEIGSCYIEFNDIPEFIKISSLDYSDIKRQIRKADEKE